MKTLKKYFVLILILTPHFVQALSLKCPDLASPDEIIACEISDEQRIGIKANLELDSNFTYQNLSVASPWKNYYHSPQGFSLGNITDNTPLNSKFFLKISSNIPINKEYTISLKTIEMVDSELQNIKEADLTSKIKIVSDIKTLDNIKINQGKLTPNFHKNITSYNVTTTAEQITIEATPTDTQAQVAGDIGTKNLNYGVNHFIIKVISTRGSTQEYHLYITRTPKKVTSIDDASLKKLIVNNHEINLEKNKFYYELEVESKIETLKIEAIPTQETSQVEIQNPEKLNYGENPIVIKVTSPSGTTYTYHLKVFRPKEKPQNIIQNIEIEGYPFHFAESTYQYTLKIKDETSLAIKVILNDKNATYTIEGNDNLKNNSQIQIIITSEQFDPIIYKIKIKKELPNNSTSISKYINIPNLILFIILVSIILIIKKMINYLHKKNNNSE